MDFRPSAKELSHFPFLKKAQDQPIVDVFVVNEKRDVVGI